MKKAEQVLPYSIDEETEDQKQEAFIAMLLADGSTRISKDAKCKMLSHSR